MAEFPYAMAVARRNRRFDRDTTLAHRVPVPVVSVGNLTTGGTGKTPLVRWICEVLLQAGGRPAIVSRGYGGRYGMNDEAMELADALPDVPQVRNPRRYQGAMQAIDESAANCIVLDDGFQHRFLARDLDIVLLDALCPFGHEHLLPRGFLRESVEGLARAHVVALSRADQVEASQREQIRSRVRSLSPGSLWCELAHRPVGWRSLDGGRHPLSQFASKRVAAFCGIGNPQAFAKSLQQCGCDVVGLREFPDHHAYSARDLESLQQWARQRNHADALVCTMKDFVKLHAVISPGEIMIAALEVQLAVLVGEAEFKSRVTQLLAHPMP
ncbi:MAG: hypothetical protein RIS70_2631 [Planctomycetota bacterium]